MSIGFISDTHLSPYHEKTLAWFLLFLQSYRDLEHLYILGDLFNYWLGDDISLEEHREFTEALKAYSQHTPVSIMKGNRDFMLGSEFEKASGCKLIDDPYQLELGGQKIVLTHGDDLCTDDVSYLRYKKIIRNPLVIWFLTKVMPNSFRYRLAKKLRSRSRERNLQMNIDINREALIALHSRTGADVVIHGHTHRPAISHIQLENDQFWQYVLSDWDNSAHVLIWDDKKFESIFPPLHNTKLSN